MTISAMARLLKIILPLPEGPAIYESAGLFSELP